MGPCSTISPSSSTTILSKLKQGKNTVGNNYSRFILKVIVQVTDDFFFCPGIYSTQAIIKNNQAWSLINALAMDIRCFCPPLSVTPLSPIIVSYCWENLSISLIHTCLFCCVYHYLHRHRFFQTKPDIIFYCFTK